MITESNNENYIKDKGYLKPYKISRPLWNRNKDMI